jgi:hypothetical protein
VLAEERAKRELLTTQQLAEQTEPISPNLQLLAVSADLEELTRSAGAARKALADLPSVESELAAHRARIATLLRDLGTPLPLDQAAEAIPPQAALARVKRLIVGYRDLAAAQGEASRRVADLQLSRDELAKQLAAAPLPTDMQKLEDLVQECRSEGDPATRRLELSDRSADAKATLDSALRGTPGWTGSAEQLVSLAPLLPETYNGLAARERVIEARRLLRVADGALHSLDERHRAWAGRLATALGDIASGLPTLSHLLSAAEHVIEASKKAAAERTRLADRCDAASTALVKERSKITAVEVQAESWRRQWKDALRELGRPLNEEPEITSEILQLFTELKLDCEKVSFCSHVSRECAQILNASTFPWLR